MPAPLLIDLSNNNAVVAPQLVARQGLAGVWLKVSEGSTFYDRTFADRATALRAAGARVGGYHFAHPAIGNARSEAIHFCSLLGKIQRRDLRPVLDLEVNEHELAGNELQIWAQTWVRAVRKITGVGSLVYSSPGYLRPLWWKEPVGYGLWLASYGPDDGHDHGVEAPSPWRHVAAHQYTSRGTIPGVAGSVDLTSAPNLRPLLAHPWRGLV